MLKHTSSDFGPSPEGTLISALHLPPVPRFMQRARARKTTHMITFSTKAGRLDLAIAAPTAIHLPEYMCSAVRWEPPMDDHLPECSMRWLSGYVRLRCCSSRQQRSEGFCPYCCHFLLLLSFWLYFLLGAPPTLMLLLTLTGQDLRER